MVVYLMSESFHVLRLDSTHSAELVDDYEKVVLSHINIGRSVREIIKSTAQRQSVSMTVGGKAVRIEPCISCAKRGTRFD